MNKTVNANIGGIVFTINEDAYQKLHQYLDRLRDYFKATDVSTEIIEDLEARIAELLQTRLDGKRTIVDMLDIEAVIDTIGHPEDFEDPGAEEHTTGGRSQKTETLFMGRRLYRNPDDRVVGGVASGLAAFFNIDPIWFRLLFFLSIFFWGTGVLIYIILWIVVPEATTTTEKMRMRGEPITLGNIEKSVREQLNEMGERVKGFTQDNLNTERLHGARDNLRSGANNLQNGLSQVLSFAGKLLGIFFIIIGLMILGSLVVAVFTTSTAFSVSLPFLNDLLFEDTWQGLWLTVGVLLLTIVPIIWLITTLVLWLLKVKKNTRWIHLSFLVVFILGIGLSTYGGILLGLDFSEKGMITHKQTLDKWPEDTMVITLSDRPDLLTHEALFVRVDEEKMYINNTDFDLDLDSMQFTDIELRLIPGNDSVFVISTYYYARGRSEPEARQRARDMTYNYTIEGNQLQLDPYFSIGPHPWRDQYIRMVVAVPEGKSARIDSTLEDFEHRHYDFDWN